MNASKSANQCILDTEHTEVPLMREYNIIVLNLRTWIGELQIKTTEKK